MARERTLQKKMRGQKESLLPLKSLIWLSFDEFHIFYMFWLQWVLAPESEEPLHSTSRQPLNCSLSFLLNKWVNCSTSPNPVTLCNVKKREEGVRVRECRGIWVWKGPLRQGLGVQHLCRLFTRMFTHCHPQLMVLRGWAACPPQGPVEPFLGPYGCLIEHATLLIELTAWFLGLFPSFREGILFIWARGRDRATENREARSCQNCQENVALSVNKAGLKVSTRGGQRSRFS